MKSIVLGLALTVVSSAAMAAWTPVAEEKKVAVTNAAAQAMPAELNCHQIDTVNGQSTNLEAKVSADALALWISSSDRIFVQKGTQPLLMFERLNNGAEQRIYIYTDETNRIVNRVTVLAVVNSVKRINVGTIDEPVYEDRKVEISRRSIDCK